MDARQLEILCSLFRTAWPVEGASAAQLQQLNRWMQFSGVLLTERVALTESSLGHSDPDSWLNDEQSREDALELLVSLGAEDELLASLAGAMKITPDDLEMLRRRGHKET